LLSLIGLFLDLILLRFNGQWHTKLPIWPSLPENARNDLNAAPYEHGCLFPYLTVLERADVQKDPLGIPASEPPTANNSPKGHCRHEFRCLHVSLPDTGLPSLCVRILQVLSSSARTFQKIICKLGFSRSISRCGRLLGSYNCEWLAHAKDRMEIFISQA